MKLFLFQWYCLRIHGGLQPTWPIFFITKITTSDKVPISTMPSPVPRSSSQQDPLAAPDAPLAAFVSCPCCVHLVAWPPPRRSPHHWHPSPEVSAAPERCQDGIIFAPGCLLWWSYHAKRSKKCWCFDALMFYPSLCFWDGIWIHQKGSFFSVVLVSTRNVIPFVPSNHFWSISTSKFTDSRATKT